MESPRWTGIRYSSLKVYASTARRFPPKLRRLNIDFSLFQQARSLPIDQAMALLKRAEREGWNENRMRIEARRARWFQPVVGPDVVDDVAHLIVHGCRFRGILADPPWPWERAGGAAGASTSYYPTMPIEELCALPVAQVANDEAFLMLWCPPAGLEEHGLPLLRAWGFSYKTSACWDKMTGGFGVGAYWRMEHELLLLGVRANSPTRFCDDT